MEYQDWKIHVKISLYSSVMANQIEEHNKKGNGVVTEEDMQRFSDYAERIVDLWTQSYKFNSNTWKLYWKL